jgi:hypothetical protein
MAQLEETIKREKIALKLLSRVKGVRSSELAEAADMS